MLLEGDFSSKTRRNDMSFLVGPPRNPTNFAERDSSLRRQPALSAVEGFGMTTSLPVLIFKLQKPMAESQNVLKQVGERPRERVYEPEENNMVIAIYSTSGSLRRFSNLAYYHFNF